jgi:hypothetical protein
MVFISHRLRVIDGAKGSSANRRTTSSVERSTVAAPPIASREVEAKKAVPFCSVDVMAVSTIRTSRRAISLIQMPRSAFISALRPGLLSCLSLTKRA